MTDLVKLTSDVQEKSANIVSSLPDQGDGSADKATHQTIDDIRADNSAPQTSRDIGTDNAAPQEMGDDETVNWMTDEHFLPGLFKTIQGKMVRLVGKQNSPSVALVLYTSSKVQGNVLLNTVLGNPSALLSEIDSMYNGGFLEDDNGNENDALVLPIDAIDLSPSLKGVIVDCDLRGHDQGFTWLLNPASKPFSESIHLENALNAVKSFVGTMSHLSTKGYAWQEIDGHQFFFNAEYGSFRLVYDGIGIVKQSEDASFDQSLLNGGVSAIILFLLTGKWPDVKGNGLVKFVATDEAGTFSPATASLPAASSTVSGEPDNADAVESLKPFPTALRNALFDSCFNAAKKDIKLDEWMQILQDAIGELDKCVFCGHDVFKTAMKCLSCGKTTLKENLLTKWSIHTTNQPEDFRMAFGRGALVPGEFFGVSSTFKPFMRIVYNRKSNMLGIKNISSIRWHVTADDTKSTLLPGSVIPITGKMTIEFEGYPGVEAQFLGFDL